MTNHKSFSSKVRAALKYYVYAYYDPRTKKPFYIGQGQDNRVFAHLRDESDKEKVHVIRELEALGMEPEIRILRHGLNAAGAKLVESVAIDLLGVDNLTNEVRGHHSRRFGNMSIDEIIRLYDAEKVDIEVPAILIRINTTYRPGMTRRELYEMTRTSWVVSATRCEKVRYAMPVYQGVILEVYEIATWLPGGAVFAEDFHEGRDLDKTAERREFVGRIAKDIRHRYVGKSVAHIWKQGAQNPIRYVNIDGDK